MTTLVCEEPFSAAIESSLLTNVCHGCFKCSTHRKLKSCSRCSTVHYCSVKCQKKDWPDHSAECRCLKSYSPRVPSCFARLLARFYWKWSTQGSSVVSFNARRCCDLMDNCEKLIESTKHVEYFSSLFKILVDYMRGTDIVSDKKEMFSAYGKIVTNAFAITDATSRTLGTGLYLGISAQDHSCTPDVFVLFEGATAVMRSPEEGKRYDRSLTISYVDIMELTQERNKILHDQFCFQCFCSSCISKEEDSWKLSINTFCCKGGFCLVDPSNEWHPVCILCEKQVPISLKEAMDLNANAEVELNNKSPFGTASENELLEHWLEVFEKFVKVLSPFNTYLVGIAQKFLSAAECVNRVDLLCKYADFGLAAYRKYLPRGHPELTQRLRTAFLRKMQYCPATEFRSLLVEAHGSAILSHGEDHSITRELSSHLTLVQ
ncbi:unnamed protein product [Cylicocyclus nassatus]|uniref:MYND-type domain-containing protein n=1 Tax=Cylicocyclus nassatus TaxID=53992 RepID=A0AA36HF43_CYLNA|nr:unnamed protein product [Cylicocyclus nassatus]